MRLLEVTETLAAARTPETVFGVILTPALEALNAAAGAVLLVGAEAGRLKLVAAQGHAAGAQALWHGGPVTERTPTGDALRRQEPLFFEQPGDLVRAYPTLEARTGVVAGATAVLPMVLDGRPLGVLVLDVGHPRAFSSDERHFLRILAAQSALALGRAQLLTNLRQQQQEADERARQLLADARAHEAFVAFTEAVDQETDLLYLARQAVAVLRGRFPEADIGYYTPAGDVWKAQVWSDDMDAALVKNMTAGLPGSTPLIRRTLETGAPVFTATWNPEREEIAHSGAYGVGAAYPLRVGGAIRHLLLIGLKDTQEWSGQDQALVRSVGRGLNLALDRAEQVERQERQTAQLDARNRALEGFAELTRDLSLEVNPYVLVQRAQSVALSLLPEGYALYFELEGDRWALRGQTGDLRREALQAAADAGLPYHEANNLLIPYHSRTPYYQDQYARHTDNLGDLVGHLGASATLPVLVNGQVRGVFAVVLFGSARSWTRPDQAALEAVVYSLGLALERADTAVQLQVRTEEAERRVQALEAFAVLTAELNVEQGALSLIRQAQEVVLRLLPLGHSGYWEPEQGLWRRRTVLGDRQPQALRALVDAGFTVGRTPSLDRPWQTGEPEYHDQYRPGTDAPPEVEQPARSTVVLPVWEGTRIRGVMDFTTYIPHPWQPADRAMLTSVMQSLKLALERAQGVKALAERTAELERSNTDLLTANQELEAFSYGASHDLRTPVRHVKGFTEMAGRALEQGDLGKVRRHHQVIDQAADRMNDLIDAMLVLSQAGRAPVQLTEVPLGQLVTQAQRDVRLEFPDQQVSWQVGALPVIQADPQLLQQVLTNLLSNAVKYGQGRDPLIVEVWGEEQPDEVCVFVRDNGVGFDPRYADRLFGVFQRLHRQEEFRGTGVGLATVRRLITRHGGRVWAEGHPGEGAMFGFSLPQQ
ncbi:GAF domain-containing protein [Deinococcus petrolearius]|uniref:histidine kinase n=1 Tax=Deinococcus petrolearius TaxID=1751295 RepID=A0ABW1DFQ6_9DEIO